MFFGHILRHNLCRTNTFSSTNLVKRLSYIWKLTTYVPFRMLWWGMCFKMSYHRQLMASSEMYHLKTHRTSLASPTPTFCCLSLQELDNRMKLMNVTCFFQRHKVTKNRKFCSCDFIISPGLKITRVCHLHTKTVHTK